ncbi:MAG TPA: DUF3592 domain-containing protein [Acetobacteraceae bacterium]
MNHGRLAGTTAITGLLAAAVTPFIVLFPDPPAFGPESLLLLAVFAILATLGTACRAEWSGRRRILRRAGVLFGVTAATTLSSMALRGGVPSVPTLDLLPALFSLRGEDVDAAIRFEAWCEMWLGWALVAALLAWLLHRRPAPPPGPWDVPAGRRPWNAATILLWVVGWCAMAGAMAQGHQTAAFMARAARAEGTIANDDAHPLIRFTIDDGRVVTFRQNGGISRAVGAAVPVAYDPADPAGSAQASTVLSAWGEVMGLAWIGLGFTLFPFFGVRAAFCRR